MPGFKAGFGPSGLSPSQDNKAASDPSLYLVSTLGKPSQHLNTAHSALPHQVPIANSGHWYLV